MATACDLLDHLVDGLISGAETPPELDGIEVVLGRVVRSVRTQPNAQARAAGRVFLVSTAMAAGWHTETTPAP